MSADLVYLFYIVELYTDPLDVTPSREIVDIVADAILNPNKTRPTGELFIGTIAQQSVFKKEFNAVADVNHGRFWARFVQVTSATARRHFIDEFPRYFEAIVEQAHVRQTRSIPNFDDYLSVRRRDVAVYTFFPLIGSAFELPDEVYYHPVVVELSLLAVDMIIIDNVRCSMFITSGVHL